MTSTGSEYDEQALEKLFKKLKGIHEQHIELFYEVAEPFAGRPLTADDADTFGADAEVFLNMLRGARSLEDTVRLHIGKTMNKAEWLRLCWQIVSNLDLFEKGLTLMPDVSSHSKQWILADIVGVDTEPVSGEYCELTFRALTGRAAGWTMKQSMSEKRLRFTARVLGYKGYADHYKYDGDPFYMYGLFFAAYIEDMKVERFACDKPLYDINRKIIRMRYRDPGAVDGQSLDKWGRPMEESRIKLGCPDKKTEQCWDCPAKRYRPNTMSQVDTRGSTCAAGYGEP